MGQLRGRSPPAVEPAPPGRSRVLQPAPAPAWSRPALPGAAPVLPGGRHTSRPWPPSNGWRRTDLSPEIDLEIQRIAPRFISENITGNTENRLAFPSLEMSLERGNTENSYALPSLKLDGVGPVDNRPLTN